MNNSMDLSGKLDALVVKSKKGMPLPHRVMCNPIKLAKAISDEAQLEKLLLSFLNQNKELFGIDIHIIEKRSIYKKGKVWYANFYQTFDSKEILDSEITFRVNENGNLFMYGLDYYGDVHIESFKSKSKSLILEALKSEFASKSEIEYEFLKEYILPSWKNGKLEFKTVQEVLVHDHNQISEVLFVDKKDGTLAKRIHKFYHCNISGASSANILPTIPTESQELRTLPFLNVIINGEQITGDENGELNYTIQNSSTQIIAGLNGKYVSLQNFIGDEARIEMDVNSDEHFSMIWDDSNSTLSERNVYYHITKMHEYNKEIDADFVGLDYPLQCIVNDNSVFCNAYWNGNNLHFNTQNANCSMNSAHGASVIYHEYGHAINDRLYNQIGFPWGLKNPILHEAFSDIYSTLLLNDSRFALGWFGPDTMTRNLNNSNRYPNNIVGQQHTDGLILGGAFWDLGQLTTPEIAYQLSHQAKYGAPDDEDLAVAFAEVYLETLVADDDDGNLLNGSPNSQAIQEAFCKHGIGKDLLISQKLIHSEFPNTTNLLDEYRISVNLPHLNIGSDYDHLTLVYSTDNFASDVKLKMEEESDLEYVGYIPVMEEGTLVKYYFEILDNECNVTYYHPSLDFHSEYYSFLAGTFELVFNDDFEEDLGWQFFNESDNATAGNWQRGIPQQVINEIGQLVSPGFDNSVEGDKCMVTGAQFGNIWYANDVDGGKTTVTSPTFSDLDDFSVFKFHKWFTHGSGFIFPVQGQWKVQVSNNGVNWVTVEQTGYGDHRDWIKGMYRFSDYVDITDQMQARVEVSDFGQGSIVEGLLDDFKIYNLKESTSTLDFAQNLEIDVFPNPSSGDINIVIPEEISENAEIRLYTIFGSEVLHMRTMTSKNSTKIDLSDLNSGVYILNLRFGFMVFSKRISII